MTLPRLSPNKRQTTRTSSVQGLRRPTLTMSLRTTSASFKRPSTPNSYMRSTSTSMSSRNSSPSRPSSQLSNNRPGSRNVSRPGSRLSNGSVETYKGTISVSVRPKPGDVHHKWVIEPEESRIYSSELGDFTFDNVFGLDVDNGDVYAGAVESVIDKTLQGFNGTVFAYGMTGSGKTHSMQGNESDPGVIPLAAARVFDHVETLAVPYEVRVSYLEIYNERIFDLLSDPVTLPSFGGQNDLKIRDDAVTGVKVMGLTELVVLNVQELLEVIQLGDLLRKTGATDYNQRSSRSHAVVLIRLTSTVNDVETVATLSLCDLAGSERATNQTERRQEGSFINKSLLALSSVISKLSSKSLGHIPYRDSKLTRLLQPALSGNSVIAILCTIHLSEYGETVNTLRFAARAKNIQLNVSKNEAGNDRGTVDRLQAQIQKMKLEIDLLQASNGLSKLNFGAAPDDLAQIKAENRLLTERIEHLTRLTEEKATEQVIVKNDVINELTRELRNPGSIRSLEELFRQKNQEIEEYNSYITHLENELGKYEMKKYSGSLTGLVSPSKVRENVYNNGDQLELKNLIESQQEELEELNESIKDKDRIIKALRTSNRFKLSLRQ